MPLILSSRHRMRLYATDKAKSNNNRNNNTNGNGNETAIGPVNGERFKGNPNIIIYMMGKGFIINMQSR